MKKVSFFTIAFMLLSLSIFSQYTSNSYTVNSGDANGIFFWGNYPANSYGFRMGATSEFTYPPVVTGYSIKTFMNNTAGRGWTWGTNGVAPVAALGVDGSLQIKKDFYALGNVGVGTATPVTTLDVNGTISATSYLRLTNQDTYVSNSNTSGSSTLRFGVGGVTSTKMIILNNGSVGIGTLSPVTTLDVNGTISATSYIRLTNTDGYISNSNASGNLRFSTGGITSTKMSILNNGSVGIGTTNPDAKLTVAGTQSWTLPDQTLKINDWALVDAATNQWTMHAYNASGNIPMSFSASQFFFHEGSVGIGTNIIAGNAKLAVNGKIRATEVEVMTDITIADYVFEKDYKLRPLEELENYVTLNKHLPEVPSAKEVKENGLNMAEMDNTLLKKVEELTLYLIEQNKKIEAQQKEIELLRNQISK